MARAIWKGSISFGLVNIPVTLFPGERRPDISLHMLDSRNHARVRYERVNAETGEEVPWDAIVRGYEYDGGQYVVLSDEEMEQVKVEVTKTVEIEDFVDEKEIDPVYFDKPYFLVPDKKHRAAMKGYALLRETLRDTGKVGIAQVVIRSREYLCALMVRNQMLVLNLLRFANELRDPSEYELPGDDLNELKISKKETEMAKQLVEAMSGDWNPEQYQDSYRAALMAWIDKKIEEGQYEAVTDLEPDEPAASKDGKVVDLMDYLKKSVEEAKGGRKSGARKSSQGKQTGKGTKGKKKAAKKSARKKSAKKQSRKRKAG